MEYSDADNLSGINVAGVHRLKVASRLTELPMNSDSNISPHALGMSVKMELEKRRLTQTQKERQTMYAGSFSRTKAVGMSDEISDAANIMKRLDATSNSLVFREALATRMRLRTMALRNFSKHNYSDALLEAHYSLLLAKKFHMQVRKTPLSGEMTMELLVLTKCYAHIGHFHKGREHLAEFKFLVENTLLQYSKGPEALSPDAKYAVIECDKKLFLSIVYLLAEILTSYGMWEDAELFFSKYLALYSQVYGEFDLGLSSALNSVCIYMLKGKQYLKALPLCIKSLEILKKHLGDYDAEQPNLRVADAYNNLGIVYRLLNNPVDALQQFFKAIDMKMRVYDDRNNPAVQDIFLSIGCCLHVLGQFTPAASIYREVYTTRSDNLGRTHSSTVAVQQLLKDLQDDLSLRYETGLVEAKEERVETKVEEKSDKAFESPFVDVARIRALYSNKLENQKLIVPNVDVCDEVIFPSERLVDLSKKLNLKTMKLPVINVPNLSKGTLYLKDGLPAMTVNPDAADLLKSWGFDAPDVNVLGELVQHDLTQDGISLYIPIVKEDNNLLLGYHEKPLFVPNPAVYHTAKQLEKRKSDTAANFKYWTKAFSKEAEKQVLKIEEVEVEMQPTKVQDEVKEDKQPPNAQVTQPDKGEPENKALQHGQTKPLDEAVGQVPKDYVKNKVGELERQRSMKFVEKVKVQEEPIVEVPITEMIKSRLKNNQNAKFLSKIGALSNIKVKQNLTPKIEGSVLKKTVVAKKVSRQMIKKVPTKSLKSMPKHKSAMPIAMDTTPLVLTDNVDSDNDTIMDNSDYIHSTSETPVNSDHESFNDYAMENVVFTDPTVYAMADPVEVLSPVNTFTDSFLWKLPMVLKNSNDVLPLELAKRVKLIRTNVKATFNDFTESDDKKEDPKDGDKKDEKEITKETKNAENKENKNDDTNKNMCVLLDSEGKELAYVPWTVDLVSLSLAKSCLEEDFIKRYSYLIDRNKLYVKTKHMSLFKVQTEEERKKNELLLCRMLLAGQGLEELGFAKIATSMQAITNDLTSGLSLNVPSSVLENIKHQQELLEKQKKEIEENQKKKEELVKKEVAAKKAPPPAGKKAPPPPGGAKKAPPLKAKGPLPAPSKGGLVKGVKKAAPKASVESNVRRFFWDPIFGDDAKDTMFAKQKIVPKVENAKIEESFAKATPKLKDKTTESKPKFIQLLPDSKRSYNMNIGLSKFNKYTFNEIREAIIHLDPNILNVDATEALILLLPTNEELSIVSEFVKSGGDLGMVDKPEQFVAVLVGVPIMKQRLECHQIALTFKDNYNDIYEPLENIMDSCEAIMGSVKLSIFSHFILSVGNTLNEGDPKKGNAEGFKPTTYPKLNDFRTTTKPSKTLLQYICEIVGDEDENILDLTDDLKSLDSGSKVDIGALDEKMNRFKNDLTKIKNAIELSQKTTKDFTDHFPSIMNEFLRDAEPKVNSLLKHYQDVMNMFKETVRFSGYTEKEVDKVKPNELFKYIWAFAQSVDVCRKQRIEARNKEEKKAQAQAKMETQKVVKAQPKTTKQTAVPKLQNDDMVNIVKAL